MEPAVKDFPTCLANYPYVLVRFACWHCPRRGQARLATLAEKHGAACDLEALLDRVAFTCSYPRQPPDGRRKFRKYQPRCGIYLPDIEASQPPPPDEPPPVGEPGRPRLVVDNGPDEAA
jgi:hypothetical protein